MLLKKHLVSSQDMLDMNGIHSLKHIFWLHLSQDRLVLGQEIPGSMRG
jgi:hypothetical protein